MQSQVKAINIDSLYLNVYSRHARLISDLYLSGIGCLIHRVKQALVDNLR